MNRDRAILIQQILELSDAPRPEKFVLFLNSLRTEQLAQRLFQLKKEKTIRFAGKSYALAFREQQPQI